jgi:hypothetical protein
MKLLIVILLSIILAAGLLPQTPVRAEVTYPPHQDPTTAESIFDAYSFLTYYANIFMLISLREYENATKLITQLKLLHIPEDLRYIIQRYNNLTLELNQILANLEKMLEEVSTLLSQYRLEEALQVMSKAGMQIGKAQILLKDLEEATETLSERLGIFSAPAESRIREAYNKLQDIFQRLKALVDQYLKLLLNLRNATFEMQKEIEEEELKPTQLTLNLNKTKAFVGESIDASGILTSNGERLQNRTIIILLDEKLAATATTSVDGSYKATVKIPYIYVHIMTVKALYTPTGDDRGVYLASLSPQIQIQIMFYETNLEIAAPDTAHPGLSITVMGNATSKDGTIGERQAKILLDDNLLKEVKTDFQGLFEARITLNPQTTTGRHTLTVTIEPKEVYAGASKEKALNVEKIKSAISIHAPSFLILPAKTYIEGNVSSKLGPIQKAKVTLKLGESEAVAITSQNGEFNATIEVPLNLNYVGFQQLTATVEPSEPWHASAQTQLTILVINPTNIGLTSAAFISVGAVIYTKMVKAKPRKKKAEISEVALPLEQAKATPPLKPELKFEGVKGKVLEAYAKAMKVVEEKTGIYIMPYMTIREYMWETKPKLNGVAAAFADLTFLAERALYSPYTPDAEEIARAENLASNIEMALSS